MMVKQILATELKQDLQQDRSLVLLDVREPNEFNYARIEGSTLIPLNQLPARLSELVCDDKLVVLCHHGMRSQQAAQFLVHAGFSDVSNLVGGIDAWSCQCDSSVPRY
jgi:rhodanese-related sulfurtransferase